MYSYLQGMYAEKSNHIREGCYVTLYINWKGAFHGFLHHTTPNQADATDVLNRFHVILPGNRRLIADLQTLNIRDNERLLESRYFIDIGKPYVISGAFTGAHNEDELRFVFTVTHPATASLPVNLHAGIDSLAREYPKWVNKNYNLLHPKNRQIIESNVHTRDIRDDLGSSGAGPSHGSPDDEN